jgi:hypothetical protein
MILNLKFPLRFVNILNVNIYVYCMILVFGIVYISTVTFNMCQNDIMYVVIDVCRNEF